jgi:hypothetical protein
MGQLTQEEGKAPSKAGPAGTHRGGGTMTGRRGRLGTTVFRWRGGSGDLWRLRGAGGPRQEMEDRGARHLWCGRSKKKGARENLAATGAAPF